MLKTNPWDMSSRAGSGATTDVVTDHATNVVGMSGVGDLILDHLDTESLGRARGVSKTWRDAVDERAGLLWAKRERSVSALRAGGALVWDGGRKQAHDFLLKRRFSQRWFDFGKGLVFFGDDFVRADSQYIDPVAKQFYQLAGEGQRVTTLRAGQPGEWVNVCLPVGNIPGFGGVPYRSGPVLLVGDQAAWGEEKDLGRIFDLVPWFNIDRKRYVWAGCVPLAEWKTVQPYLAQSCGLFPEDDAPKPNWNCVLWLDETRTAVGPLPALSEADWTTGHRLLG